MNILQGDIEGIDCQFMTEMKARLMNLMTADFMSMIMQMIRNNSEHRANIVRLIAFADSAYGVDDQLPAEYKRHFRLIEKFVPVTTEKL
ncbi:hypothetical protein DAPPUDRAFT_336998 [Daphnia pulex]|uniref:Uncharacterized protein n=1 Tax=Daphnia pulex TaxID=6669 RepID=E9I0S9_DAPPU|nr:hypothetical protein DAPPUDRAFT_336998 [Daphnia pulex]|eukprot:EFX62401.1 hypothetical protein DAPPUDRAFT_336998 [Daphnia pulex]